MLANDTWCSVEKVLEGSQRIGDLPGGSPTHPCGGALDQHSVTGSPRRSVEKGMRGWTLLGQSRGGWVGELGKKVEGEEGTKKAPVQDSGLHRGGAGSQLDGGSGREGE